MHCSSGLMRSWGCTPQRRATMTRTSSPGHCAGKRASVTVGEGKIQLHRKIPKYVRTTCLAWTPREGGSVRGTTWWCPRLWPSRIGQVCRQDSTMRWWQHHEMVHEVIAEQGIWSATSYTDRQVYCRANRLRDKVVGRSRRI